MQTMMEKGTDKQLREAVLRQLEWEPEIMSQDISVDATDGVVTLTGYVNGYSMKVVAEESAKSVWGVRSVANHIDAMPITGYLADPFGDGDCNIRDGLLEQAATGDRTDALSH